MKTFNVYRNNGKSKTLVQSFTNETAANLLVMEAIFNGLHYTVECE